jgi:hypothetical protein
MTAIAALLIAVGGRAADLKPETLKAWNQYIEEKKIQAKSLADASLVAANDDRDLWTELRSGKILVAPAGPKLPRRVPSGLIHDWMGTAFIPSATILQVLAVVRDYDRYKDVYRPGVIDSQACVATKDEDRFSLVLMNKSFFAKKAFKGDYRARYFRLDDNRWYSIAESTRTQEIEGYGGADARLLPEGEGSGLIWRAAIINRYEARDGGVIVQFEGIVLSRDIPEALRWVIDPIVRRVSRESIQLSLEKTRDAVRTLSVEHRWPAAHPGIASASNR